MDAGKMTLTIGIAVAELLALTAVGETYTYLGGAGYSTMSDTAYTNAKYWKNSAGVVGTAGDALDPDGDYVVNSGLTIYTPNSSKAEYAAFPGQSLTINGGSFHTYISGSLKMSFGAKGLF